MTRFNKDVIHTAPHTHTRAHRAARNPKCIMRPDYLGNICMKLKLQTLIHLLPQGGEVRAGLLIVVFREPSPCIIYVAINAKFMLATLERT